MGTDSKVAIITGASQAIGEGLVRGYLARGYRVVANSRSIRPDAYEGDALAVAGDITDPAVAERVVRGAVERFGRVDTLVNNAGVFVPGPFTEYIEDDYARLVSLNLGGFFHVTQPAIRQMLAPGADSLPAAHSDGRAGPLMGLLSRRSKEKMLAKAARKIAWAQRRNATTRKSHAKRTRRRLRELGIKLTEVKQCRWDST